MRLARTAVMSILIETLFEPGRSGGWWRRCNADPEIENLLPGVKEIRAGARLLFEMPLNGIIIDWTAAPENSRPWCDPIRRCPNCGRLGMHCWTRTRQVFDHRTFLLARSKLAVRHPLDQCVKASRPRA